MSFRWMLAVLLAIPAICQANEPRPPLIVAHRGLLQHAPENTLANFRACLELRLGFEFDVQRTKDGTLICMHDSTVDRTTDGSGRVSEMTLQEIEELDAGNWFDPKFAGEKVPTVKEVFSLLAQYPHREMLIAVDLKGEHTEVEVATLAKEQKVLHRLLFIGRTISDPEVRHQIKAVSSHAHTAAVANDTDEFTKALMLPDTDWIYFRFLPSSEQVEAVHRADKRAFIAGPTVAGNEPENWREAANAGIHAILTDYPLELRSLLRERAANE